MRSVARRGVIAGGLPVLVAMTGDDEWRLFAARFRSRLMHEPVRQRTPLKVTAYQFVRCPQRPPGILCEQRNLRKEKKIPPGMVNGATNAKRTRRTARLPNSVQRLFVIARLLPKRNMTISVALPVS